MDELFEVLSEYKVSLSAEEDSVAEPAWAIRSMPGGVHYCAFRTDPGISAKDFVSLYVKPAASSVRAAEEGSSQESGNGVEDLS